MTATVRRGPGTNSRLSPVKFSLVLIAATLFRFSAKALADPLLTRGLDTSAQACGAVAQMVAGYARLAAYRETV